MNKKNLLLNLRLKKYFEYRKTQKNGLSKIEKVIPKCKKKVLSLERRIMLRIMAKKGYSKKN
jgi:hypothetical protein